MGEQIINLIMAAVGAFLIRMGLRGEGKIFEHDEIKLSEEEFRRRVRILCYVVGGLLFIDNMLIYLEFVAEYTPLYWALMVLDWSGIVVFLISLQRMNLKKPKQQ